MEQLLYQWEYPQKAWALLMNPNSVYAACLLIAVLILAWVSIIYRADNAASIREKPAMPKHWRKREDLQKTICDILVDTVEDARYKGLLTRKQKLDLYKKFAFAFELPDLLPVPKNKKKAAQERLHRNRIVTPKIPGEPPPQVNGKGRKLVNRRSTLSTILAANKA